MHYEGYIKKNKCTDTEAITAGEMLFSKSWKNLNSPLCSVAGSRSVR